MRAILAGAQAVWPWVVCERAGEVAGFAYASAHRTRSAYRYSVDTSTYVHARHRRAGVARLAYTALFGLLARQGTTTPLRESHFRTRRVSLHTSQRFREVARYANVGFKSRRVARYRLVPAAFTESPKSVRIQPLANRSDGRSRCAIDDDEVRRRQLRLDPCCAAAFAVDVEAQRGQPSRRIRRDFGHRARDIAPLAIGTAAKIIGRVDAKREILGEPLEGRLNLTDGWRKRGRRGLSTVVASWARANQRLEWTGPAPSARMNEARHLWSETRPGLSSALVF